MMAIMEERSCIALCQKRVCVVLDQSRVQACGRIMGFAVRGIMAPVSLALLSLCFVSGCGSSTSSDVLPQPTPPPQTTVSVSISPTFTEVKRGTSGNFSAAVVNAKDTSVTWSIQEGAAGGSITSAGVYTAPDADGDYHIVATSHADKTKGAVAKVTVAASVFTAAGDLHAVRYHHTATLLPNGQVFIAGGEGKIGHTSGMVVSGAEEFNPVEGVFHSAGTLARAGHTATLLANGDVLFTGGRTDDSNGGGILATAELLKADTGSLEPTGNMLFPRIDHTATLLEDGRVLIAGGLILNGTDSEISDTAELYDPASGTFSPAGSMSQPRSHHVAALLSSGKVLLIGDGSAELYNPATNTFTVTSSKPASRSEIVVTTLSDGKVLITGGYVGYYEEYGGASELFDPVTEQFTTTGALVRSRFFHTATLLPDGTVLVAGGTDAGSGSTYATEIYDPATGKFRSGPRLLYDRGAHTGTLLPDGSVLFVGGYQFGSELLTAEIYK